MSNGLLEQYITTRSAAERLGVSLRRVQQLCQTGKLVTAQVGRELLVDQSSLDAVTVYGKPGRPKKQDEGGTVTAQAGNGKTKAKVVKPAKQRTTKKAETRKGKQR